MPLDVMIHPELPRDSGDLLASNLGALEEDVEASLRRWPVSVESAARPRAPRPAAPPAGRYNESALKQDNSNGYAAIAIRGRAPATGPTSGVC